MIFFLLIFCSVLPAAFGRCPNHCSGHGDCIVLNHAHTSRPGGKFLCQCWPGFMGMNCADRQCPHDRAWSDAPYGSNLAHEYQECSGRGECDSNTGTCLCYEGSEGQSCNKLKCPNDCSGHGTCESIGEFTKHSLSTPRQYSNWDSRTSWGCNCDPGYWGGDCALRRCPAGDDPGTNKTVLGTNSNLVASQNFEVQLLRLDGIHDVYGTFTLSYKAIKGRKFTTRPITVMNDVFTTSSHFVKAVDYGNYGKFIVATYTERTGTQFCPYQTSSCQSTCNFGLGIGVGDVFHVEGPSQSTKYFTVTGATPCEITVTPDPNSANAEAVRFTMIKGGKTSKSQSFIGRSGVKHGLMGLPNRVIEEISVSEDVRHNARKDFKITFDHHGNSGDQNLLECNPKGCNSDGCQPRFTGLQKTLGRIQVFGESGSPVFSTTFIPKFAASSAHVSGTSSFTYNSILVQCKMEEDYHYVMSSILDKSGCEPFVNILQPGDAITISGTGTDNDKTYTIAGVTSSGNEYTTLLVNEEIVSYSQHNYEYSADIVRYFGAPVQIFSISIPSGPKVKWANDTFAAHTNLTFIMEGEQDFLYPLLVGDEIVIDSAANAVNTHAVGKRYEVVNVVTELIIYHPDNITISNSQSSLTVERSTGSCNVTELTTGNRKAAECSSRGVCNHETGLCECFQQYSGLACQKKSVIA